MKLLSSLRIGVLAFSMFFGVNGHAAVTHIVSGGLLVGATGIEIDTDSNPATPPEIFNVSFINSFFNDAFPFGIPAFHNTQALATLFSEALEDQVFINVPSGNFDTDPTLTLGCTTSLTIRCTTWTPFSASDLDVLSIGFVNDPIPDGPNFSLDSVTNSFSFPRSTDLNSVRDEVFAKFTQVSVSAVPEPSTYAMMLAGVLMIAGVKRRRDQA